MGERGNALSLSPRVCEPYFSRFLLKENADHLESESDGVSEQAVGVALDEEAFGMLIYACSPWPFFCFFFGGGDRYPV